MPLETITSSILAALSFPVRKGWICFIFGALIFVIHRAGWLGGEPIPYLSSSSFILALFGVVIITVDRIEAMWSSFKEKRIQKAQQNAQQEREMLFAREGVQNLNVLNAVEVRYLYWIIKEGNQRFQASLPARADENLVRKKILYQDFNESRDIYSVNPAVWALRSQFLASHPQLQALPEAPWLGYTNW